MRAAHHLAVALGILLMLPTARGSAQNDAGLAPPVGANGSALDRARHDESAVRRAVVTLAPRVVPAAHVEERLALDSELRSIDWGSRHATRLYVASLVLFLVGGHVTVTGYVLWSFLSSFESGGAALTLPMLTLGSAMGLVSLVTFACAIGFDVDSGARRSGYGRRRAALGARLGVSPLGAGAIIVLGGSF